MIEPQFLDVLRQLCIRLVDCQSAWAVTGSLGLTLQGMQLEVHDIDIQTDQQGAYQIESLFSEYVIRKVEYRASERIRSHFGALEIEGVKVEIMGDLQKLLDDGTWEEPVRVEKYRQWLNFEGMQVPVLTLEYEYQAYRKMGRLEKAEKINVWLEENHTRQNAG